MYFFVFLVLLQASCAGTAVKEEDVEISYDAPGLFGSDSDVNVADDLFYLTEQQKQHFLGYFNSRTNDDLEPYMRVFDYLDGGTFDFSYRSTTSIASETFRSETGNCMSLAILTTALARIADVKVGYQLIDSTPVFEKKDDVIIKGVHVRTKLYRANVNPMHLSLTKPGLIVDYFPGGDKRFLGNITEDEFIAMFFRNIAAEYLEKKDYKSAYWNMRKALDYAPYDHSNINSMAVIFKKSGDEEKAEEIYQYGIEISDQKLSLLKNYRILLESQGRVEEAKAITDKISMIDDPSPYSWINIADYAFEAKNYTEAIRYYQKAVELAPYLQYAYLGLAKTYYAQGKIADAKEMIIQAMENNSNRQNSEMYRAKLRELEEEEQLKIKILDSL